MSVMDCSANNRMCGCPCTDTLPVQTCCICHQVLNVSKQMAAFIPRTGVAQYSLHFAAADDSLPVETPALPCDTDAQSQPGEPTCSQPPASKKTSLKDELLQHLMQVRHEVKICFCSCSLFALYLVVIVLVSSVGPALYICRSPWPHSTQAVTTHSYLGTAENALPCCCWRPWHVPTF